MKKWQSQHKCKVLCRKLGLSDCVIDIKENTENDMITTHGPLRIGFPSPKVESP